MAKRHDDDEKHHLPVPLDGPTRRWLALLSLKTGDSIGRIIASMLRDIRIDDETAHKQLH